MRKVILFIAMSLDGFIATKEGSIDWLSTGVEPREKDTSYEDFYKTVDTVLLGRTTYDQVVNELSPDIYPYEDAHSYIFTSRKETNTEQLTFTDESVVEVVRKLKKVKGENIWVVGGSSLIEPLIEEELIDEYQLTIIPIILGEGISLFKKSQKQTNLSLLSSRAINGLVQVTYQKE